MTGNDLVTGEEKVTSDDKVTGESIVTGVDTVTGDNIVIEDGMLTDDDMVGDDDTVTGDSMVADNNTVTGDNVLSPMTVSSPATVLSPSNVASAVTTNPLPTSLTELLFDISYQTLDKNSLLEKAKQLFITMKISDSECEAAELCTKQQRESDEWYLHCKGQITALLFPSS